MNLRYLYALMGIFLLLAATAAAGSFTAEMDVDTYVDADQANQSFTDNDLLWAASAGAEPTKLVYLSVINMFGAQGIFKPEQIASATLTLDAAKVDKPGNVKAYFLQGPTLETAALGLSGYAGIDFVLGERPRAVDVNARPTTSIIGIARVMKEEIGELILGARFGGMAKKVTLQGEYTFRILPT